MDYSTSNADYVLEDLKKFSLKLPRGTAGEFKMILQQVELLEKDILTYKKLLESTIEKKAD